LLVALGLGAKREWGVAREEKRNANAETLSARRFAEEGEEKANR
jgi:hypothetical protein